MMAAELELDDDQEEEELEPSLALPPLYVLRTAVRCPECRKGVHVYALGCTAFHDAEEDYTIEQFHFLSFISSRARGAAGIAEAQMPQLLPRPRGRVDPPLT